MSDNEVFRDSINTITQEGKRAWITPKKPKGKLYNRRKITSYLLLSFLISAPFIKVGDNQLMMFNILDRRFNIFGFLFWPQDFYLFVIFMIVGVVFVGIFTLAFGRIFCGWICPQTIFLEMVFRRIEYWIEGDRNKQLRLNKEPWNAYKIKKKVLKWFIFLIISFIIANVFLAYLVGGDYLLQYISEGPLENLSTFISLIIFTSVFYFVFVWFREQVCIIACPYGRLQGVLLDKKSIIVSYDHKRGEREKGRKKWKKGEDRIAEGHGDCIDCHQCVHVCPTGIDIRNGTQLECVNCTACIDECNTIMQKVNQPTGLIRYASESEIENKEPFKFNNRFKGYTAILFILTALLIGMLFLRNNTETHILRLPGQLYEHKDNNIISNVFTYKIINKTNKDIDQIHFKLKGIEGNIKIVATKKTFVLPKAGEAEGTMFIELDQGLLEDDKNKITIEIYSDQKLIETTSVNFLGPRTYN